MMSNILAMIWGVAFLVLLIVGITLTWVGNSVGWPMLGVWSIWLLSGVIVAGAFSDG